MMLSCDYLIVGAGAASLAFIDTLITEHPSSKIILVDQKDAPGGQWNDAYGFVQLHQPSFLYGVASRQLEGSWLKLLITKFQMFYSNRATKWEILRHYQTFVDDKVAAGQLEFYPRCCYNFGDDDNATHKFVALDGTATYEVDVKIKFINGILGECQVPTQTPLPFPVDEEINVMTSDDIYNEYTKTNAYISKNTRRHYVVLGMGKTGMDIVVYLQRTMKIDPSQISWVVPNDVWMITRESSTAPETWPMYLLKNDCNFDEAALHLEREGKFVRLDEKKYIKPTKFRFPIIGKDELWYMRQVPTVIRRGRTTMIRQLDGEIVVEFGSDRNLDWIPPHASGEDVVFVHCVSPGPFNGNNPEAVFVSDRELNAYPIQMPSIPASMSMLAYLEASRLNDTLDLEFGRTLLQAKQGHMVKSLDSCTATANDVLNEFIQPMNFHGELSPKKKLNAIVNLAMFLVLADPDPMVAYQWLQGNRLTIYSIPGVRCGIYKKLSTLLEKGEGFGYTEGELCVLGMVRDKLKPLERN